MSEMLQWLSFVSAACASIASTVGGIKARSLRPDSHANIRELAFIVDGHLSATLNLIRPTLAQVNRTGGLDAPLDTAVQVGFDSAAKRIKKLHDDLSAGPVLSTTEVTKTASGARLWMILGAVFAALSVAFQALGFLVIGGPTSP